MIGAADRWRALDTDDTQACNYAGRILEVLGENDLAWDYLTTPLAEHSNEAGPWVNLANQLRSQGDLVLADRAFATAFEVEPTNAQVLWDRAQLLQQSGRFEEATQLYQQIANTDWQPRFDWIKQQAKRYAEGRN
ncbi:MAG: tetratricopeptide repeat protein [Firmicutes bacterium]|nr:tetratricopeptide repeat protein [Bacillota bacterium]